MVLGWLDPAYFAGGAVPLDPGRAREAIERVIARPLGLAAEDAALGIHRVANAQMTEGIRLVSIRRGLDPRLFALVALGGAGPIHACSLASELAIGTVLIPRHPGVLSAAGLLAAPVEHEVAAAFPHALDGLDVAVLRRALDDLDARCAALMAKEQVKGLRESRQYFADMWYVGQSYHIGVPVALDVPDPIAALYRAFLALHERIYGHATESPAAIVNLRAVHRAGGGMAQEAEYAAAEGNPHKGRRDIRVAGTTGPVRAEILSREHMPPAMTFAGPAVIEQADTTTLVEPGWTGTVLDNGTLRLKAPA